MLPQHSIFNLYQAGYRLTDVLQPDAAKMMGDGYRISQDKPKIGKEKKILQEKKIFESSVFIFTPL